MSCCHQRACKLRRCLKQRHLPHVGLVAQHTARGRGVRHKDRGVRGSGIFQKLRAAASEVCVGLTTECPMAQTVNGLGRRPLPTASEFFELGWFFSMAESESPSWLDFCPTLPLFVSGRWPIALITHSSMDVLSVTGLKPGHAYVVLLRGVLFTRCALAPCLYHGDGHGHTSATCLRLLSNGLMTRFCICSSHRKTRVMSAHMHFVAGVSNPAFIAGRLESVM